MMMVLALLSTILLVSHPTLARQLQSKVSLVNTNLAAQADDLSSLHQSYSTSWEPQDQTADAIQIDSRMLIPQPKGLVVVGTVAKVLWDTVLQVGEEKGRVGGEDQGLMFSSQGFFHGFLPRVERVRREVRGWLLYFLCWCRPGRLPLAWEPSCWTGCLTRVVLCWAWRAAAVWRPAGLQEGGCRRMLVCRAGRLLQTRLPGSQMLVVLLEGFVPTTARQFYSVLKKRVMEFPGASNIDSCVLEFDCSLDVKKE